MPELLIATPSEGPLPITCRSPLKMNRTCVKREKLSKTFITAENEEDMCEKGKIVKDIHELQGYVQLQLKLTDNTIIHSEIVVKEHFLCLRHKLEMLFVKMSQTRSSLRLCWLAVLCITMRTNFAKKCGMGHKGHRRYTEDCTATRPANKK